MLPTSATDCCTQPKVIFGPRTSSSRTQHKVRHRPLVCRASKESIQVTLHTPTGEQRQISKNFYSVGTAGGCDLTLEGDQVAEEHACIEVKQGRLYCSPLVGDPDNFLDETRTWLNDSEMRSGCSYLLAPGSKLAFGDQSQQYTINFEETAGPDPIGDMLLKGMLAKASPEVRKQMGEDV